MVFTKSQLHLQSACVGESGVPGIWTTRASTTFVVSAGSTSAAPLLSRFDVALQSLLSDSALPFRRSPSSRNKFCANRARPISSPAIASFNAGSTGVRFHCNVHLSIVTDSFFFFWNPDPPYRNSCNIDDSLHVNDAPTCHREWRWTFTLAPTSTTSRSG